MTVSPVEDNSVEHISVRKLKCLSPVNNDTYKSPVVLGVVTLILLQTFLSFTCSFRIIKKLNVGSFNIVDFFLLLCNFRKPS